MKQLFLNNYRVTLKSRLLVRSVSQYDKAKQFNFVRNKIMLVMKRNYAAYKPPRKFRKDLLPFEKSLDSSSTMTAFQCHTWGRKAFVVSFAGVFLGVTLLNMAELTYKILEQIDKQRTYKDENDYPWFYWWKHFDVNLGSAPMRIGLTAFVFIFAGVVFVYSMVMPARVVRELTLLKGGQKMLIETYGPFGFHRSFEVPLRDVSAVWGPKMVEQEKTMPLKVKGKRLFFQVYLDEGKITNKDLFDHSVAVQRFEVRGKLEK
ncbi:uncharacterized protein LOC128209749 [Mya arenaria]|uniref:uncharacterized protein LOC128209749 n=1 Tax=Mya arenaria TaxID=6604 RepID=UPI0022E416ED|nr:uncharacterized protein LOC128209749 [Mya arenaria]